MQSAVLTCQASRWVPTQADGSEPPHILNGILVPVRLALPVRRGTSAALESLRRKGPRARRTINPSISSHFSSFKALSYARG